MVVVIVDSENDPTKGWLKKLSDELDARAVRVQALRDYYDGNHPLPSPPEEGASDTVKRAWRALAEESITNWVKLVADAPAERLKVIDFRFSEPIPAGESNPGWDIWQANKLDADSDLITAAAMQLSTSFAMVWPNPNSPVKVDITVEDPAEVIVAYQAGSRRLRAAALKRWIDDDDHMRANVYLPDVVFKFRSQGTFKGAPGMTSTGSTSTASQWEPYQPAGETWPLRNPLGEVPIVEYRANPSTAPSRYGGGMSEFETVISIQNRINKTIFDRMVTAEHQAFRQRVVIGWEGIPTGPDGQVDTVTAKRASAARTWMFSDPAVKVTELGQADFAQFIKAIESDVQAMAAISKTPPQYLLAGLVNVSGDGMKAAESGLISKTGRHARNFGESHEELIRLALKAAGNPRAADYKCSVVWDDMESRTWGETTDAVLKMKTLGVPTEALWAMLPDITPQDVERWKVMALDDSFTRALNESLAAAPAQTVARSDATAV